MLRMLLRRILKGSSDGLSERRISDTLFRIVCRIGKNSEVKTAFYAITALYHYAMLVRLQEIIIKYRLPLCMKELPLTVRHECLGRSFTAGMRRRKVFEVRRHLFVPPHTVSIMNLSCL